MKSTGKCKWVDFFKILILFWVSECCWRFLLVIKHVENHWGFQNGISFVWIFRTAPFSLIDASPSFREPTEWLLLAPIKSCFGSTPKTSCGYSENVLLIYFLGMCHPETWPAETYCKFSGYPSWPSKIVLQELKLIVVKIREPQRCLNGIKQKKGTTFLLPLLLTERRCPVIRGLAPPRFP